jgi:lysozyme family protein
MASQNNPVVDSERLERIERQLSDITKHLRIDEKTRKRTERQLGLLERNATFQEFIHLSILSGLCLSAVGVFWLHASLRDSIAMNAPDWVVSAFFPQWKGRQLEMGAENSFEAALAFVLAEEGGYANHPNDPGGSTNKGVTQGWLNANREPLGIIATDVKELTDADVEKIYRHIFDQANCGAYDPPLSTACLDTAVNFGVGGWSLFLKETGVSGARPKQDAIAIAEARMEYRHERTREAPSQQVFLEGWLNRDNRLLDYAKKYKRTTGNGGRVAAQAESWVGKDFKPGHKYQCAYFVRHILAEAGVAVGVTQQPLDGHGASAGMANSFFGKDLGQIIRSLDSLQPGDIVMFNNTFGDWPAGTVTHVGIYVGGGQIVDRPTASSPVKRRSVDTFEFAGALRPDAYKNRLAED